MKNEALANLHEELLHFLLNYRKESKYVDDPNFLFRPASDIEALKEGRWFYDSPRSGWVDIYFTESAEEMHCQNNLQFGINLDGWWSIGLHVPSHRQGGATGQFWERLIESFYNVARRFPQRSNISDAEQITLSPIDDNYRTGLPEAIDALFQFFRQEELVENADKKDPPLSLVSNNVFQESLRVVNEYRNRQKVKQVYLNGFQIKNYQGIKGTHLDDLPPKPSWIFLTGENSFGKTCLLRALAIGLYGNEEDIITKRRTFR